MKLLSMRRSSESWMNNLETDNLQVRPRSKKQRLSCEPWGFNKQIGFLFCLVQKRASGTEIQLHRDFVPYVIRF